MSLSCMHYVITIATDVYYWYLRLLGGIHPMQLKLSFLSVLEEIFSNLSLNVAINVLLWYVYLRRLSGCKLCPLQCHRL